MPGWKFVDRDGVITSEPAKEKEMLRLVAKFSALMHKRAVGSEGESTPISDGKRSKRSSPGEEA